MPALTSCSMFGDKLPSVEIKEATIYTAAEANDNSPVAVEMLLIKDAALIETWLWELVPGQTLTLKPVPFAGEDACGVLLYANYLKPGAHRARIDVYEGVKITLLENDMVIEPMVGKPSLRREGVERGCSA
jgi:type VI secretion system protein